MLIKKAALLFALTASLFGGAVSIRNDSAFPLHAQILAADGSLLGAMTVHPQQQMTWQNSNLNAGNTPTTPYTVIFYCLEGKEFGIVNQVGVGATVLANSANGSKVCKPQTPDSVKKEQQEQEQDPSLQDYNSHQWQQNQIN
ncbi:MAG: hypothetical protein P0S94_01055 [Simkaniaceae bacterium]|nr:hypothetical protein [Simkaniaceae bacterium]